MFWNPEVITTTGKSLRITQITFNIIYIMRTNINQGRIQSLAVMISCSLITTKPHINCRIKNAMIRAMPGPPSDS